MSTAQFSVTVTPFDGFVVLEQDGPEHELRSYGPLSVHGSTWRPEQPSKEVRHMELFWRGTSYVARSVVACERTFTGPLQHFGFTPHEGGDDGYNGYTVAQDWTPIWTFGMQISQAEYQDAINNMGAVSYAVS